MFGTIKDNSNEVLIADIITPSGRSETRWNRILLSNEVYSGTCYGNRPKIILPMFTNWGTNQSYPTISFTTKQMININTIGKITDIAIELEIK